MIIAILANLKKKRAFEIAKGIAEFLKGKGVAVATKPEDAASLDAVALNSLAPQQIKFLISLGGDGTILRLVHHYSHLKAPILGINLGNLGFMADVPLDDLYPSLEDLLQGAYKVEKRMMMEGKTAKNEECFAVNEMVVHRAKNPSLIDLSLHVDGTYLNTFSADGIIISTPSGSTAYSLASGGPILTPELEAFVITPICPHTISNRPIVLMPKSHIDVQYLSSYNPVEITFDGISSYTMSPNDIFRIKKSSRTFNIVNLNRRNYFDTLRSKLGWVGQVRYSTLNHISEDL